MNEWRMGEWKRRMGEFKRREGLVKEILRLHCMLIKSDFDPTVALSISLGCNGITEIIRVLTMPEIILLQ